jgi:hypothetical protein
MVSLFLWSCKYNLERVRSENQGDEREKKNRLLKPHRILIVVMHHLKRKSLSRQFL